MMKMIRLILLLLTSLFLTTSGTTDSILPFGGHPVRVPVRVVRTWISPDIWANPLQDWQLNNGRMECISSGGGRNLFLLTQELENNGKSCSMRVNVGRLPGSRSPLDAGWVGFLLGIQGDFKDYRDNAARGVGFPVGITTEGKLMVGNEKGSIALLDPAKDNFQLMFEAQPEGGSYRVTIVLLTEKGKEIGRYNALVDAGWLMGGVGLACSAGIPSGIRDIRGPVAYGNWGFRPGTERKGNVTFWFSDFQVSGDKFVAHQERSFGPILFCQYTLSKKVLKLTAQLVPVGPGDDQAATLEVNKNGRWVEVSKAPVDMLARTATFKVNGWSEKRNLQYRVKYSCHLSGKKSSVSWYSGMIRYEPWDQEEIVIAGFTGNNDLGFPNTDIFNSVSYQNPDMLFFSGDQIYEMVGGFGVQTEPLEKSVLDYLRKWYLFGWAYGDLLKDRPSIALPDDHDVYHGNIWGAGGIATPAGLSGAAAQDKGGYKMMPAWVNMVQRTQTSHLPDPVDPSPVEQGIGVYYTEMRYAGVSFAIIEDRKWKSAPAPLLAEAMINNGFAQNTAFSAAASADVAGASLLGDRQESFLDQWTNDWSDKTWMKVVLSQTIFANVATLPVEDSHSDAIVPKLRILKADEYPENDTVVQDFDSDAWPQTPRNKVVKIMRKGFAFHIAGDQHLGSTIQYGADHWRDGGYAFCVPAISNVWPRRWCPKDPGYARFELDPRYTGDYLDGFGNKMTVYAVSNPVYTGLEPSILYDRATGYGIIRVNRETRDITFECWPRLSNPADSASRQFPGWPIRINQLTNRTRYSTWELPLIKVPDMKNSVFQVVSEKTGQVEFTLRINGNAYKPKVDKPGKYTIWVGEPGSERWIAIPGFEAVPANITREYVVRF